MTEETTETAKPVRMSLREAMGKRYPHGQYAVFYDVPDNVGVHAKRRADALAFGMWKSVGHAIEGFEFKASRSDWLREVKQVDKADPFIERCDRWWLVTTEPNIAKLEEVPACWGWLLLTPTGLRVQKPAPLLRPFDSRVDRLFVLGVIRKASEKPVPEELAEQMAEYRRKVDADIEERVRRGIELQGGAHARMLEKVARFEKEIGMKLDDWRCADVAKIAAELAKINYGAGGINAVDNQLAAQESTLSHLLECVRLARAAIQPPTKEPT